MSSVDVVTGSAPALDLPAARRGFGVYVHVPFCRHRCDYCAFATWTDRGHLEGTYLDAVTRDIDSHVAAGMPEATSVFVGGGTPSLVEPSRLAAVLTSVPTATGAEVTVECNPEDVTADLLATYLDAGVNRVSLGVQSLVPEVLQGLGRVHDPGAVHRAVAAIRDVGMPTWNLDIIYGGAGETHRTWQRTLEAALELDPPHVSAYALTVEPGTPLAADAARHPDDDEQAERYLIADELLEAAGRRWYEISNWARPGHESRHHLLYWSQGDYVGVGCSAHSHRAGRRWWNVRTPERYVAAVREGRSPEAGGETLDGATARRERLQLALRTSAGVPADQLDTAGLPPGLVEPVADRLRLTSRGRLLANDVSLRLR